MECLRRITTRGKCISYYHAVIRAYSVFPNYHKPVFLPEEQEALEGTPKFTEMVYGKCMPSFISDTSSEFYDVQIRKFVNKVMRKGKKELARKLVDDTLKNIKLMQLKEYNNASPERKEDIEIDPKIIFNNAIKNCKPILCLLPVKKGGITYQVPSPITEVRATHFAMNWMIEAAKENKSSNYFPIKLAKLLVEAADNKGCIVKRKQDLHKQCDVNRAYAHFRW